jgi:hypothetical protein
MLVKRNIINYYYTYIIKFIILYYIYVYIYTYIKDQQVDKYLLKSYNRGLYTQFVFNS